MKIKMYSIISGWSLVEVPDKENEDTSDWLMKIGANPRDWILYSKEDETTAAACQASGKEYGFIVHIEIFGNKETILCIGLVEVMELMRTFGFNIK
jgi:predicted house-cleaning NTP pyrophosphatase (Maf/HAM1 superfamily)